MQLPTLQPARPDCTACDLHLNTTRPGVPSCWVPTSLAPSATTPVLAFVGMNPGAEEERLNEPFVDPSSWSNRLTAGRLLHRTYLPPFLPIASIYLLNGARCRTPSGDKPFARHYSICLPLFSVHDLTSIAAFHHSAPRFLVCLGADPLAAITKLAFGKAWSTRTAFAAQTSPIPLWGSWSLLSTNHPAAILRNSNLIHPVSEHLSLFYRALHNDLPVPSSPDLQPPCFPPDVKAKEV